jgi:hypothetical protein
MCNFVQSFALSIKYVGRLMRTSFPHKLVLHLALGSKLLPDKSNHAPVRDLTLQCSDGMVIAASSGLQSGPLEDREGETQTRNILCPWLAGLPFFSLGPELAAKLVPSIPMEFTASQTPTLT